MKKNINLYKEIENFEPDCEQEEVDKAYFLQFIDIFDDVLSRENEFGHFTASGVVVNPDFSKILLVYHNIFDGYIFPGGHADGDPNLLGVATREIEEETGVEAKALSNEPFSICSFPTKAHIKRGKFVSAHTHFDVEYLFVADDTLPVRIKPDENQSVIWLPIETIDKSIKLVDFFVPAYQKFIEKLKPLKVKN
jgi:8-oxo-dGTP pyrophosphatase MutT (NUDIX family)